MLSDLRLSCADQFTGKHGSGTENTTGSRYLFFLMIVSIADVRRSLLLMKRKAETSEKVILTSRLHIGIHVYTVA